MKISYISNYRLFKEKNMTIALGYFDGFHIGHMELFKKALELGRLSNTEVGLITFNMSFFEYINKVEPSYLTSTNERIELAESLGFDAIYIIELTDEFLNLSYKEFIDIFLKDMRHVVVGFDYTFGRNKEGNITNLKEELGDSITIISKIEDNNEKVGTEKIKNYLSLGMLERVEKLLSRKYTIEVMIHKKNKNYALVTNNYIPRNGDYVLTLIDGNNSFDFTAKIKKKENEKETTLKTIDSNFLSKKLEKHKVYKLTFKKYLSNIL
ncbi:FAD synthetase family protein [bacterium]|nr:FAD synthetase family protein [bacterium]